MKHVHTLVLLFIFSLLLNACRPLPDRGPRVQQASTLKAEALGPYFTKDNHGNTVLCWTEAVGQDSLHSLKYAIYDPQSNTFSEAITVSGTRGTSTASESMSKVAFKSDGTVIALFNKPFENPKSRFASAIYYTLSNDKGKSWTPPVFIHSETSEDYGRSFFDMTTLADGEVAAIWLDGRFGEKEMGSALFFSRTEKNEGFGPNTCLDKNTCECCRTEILRDEKGGIHIAYRGIQSPLDRLGKQVRDMVYASSTDHGKTFSTTIPLGKDDWEIEGCPHTGPSLAATQDAVNAIWFTGGGIPGLYFSSLGKDQHAFGAKVEMSQSGRHPQMVALKDNSLGIVWDEAISNDQPKESEATGHDHAKMSMANHSPASSRSQVVFTRLRNGKLEKQMPINDAQHHAHHPVITAIDNGILTAWVSEDGEKSSVVYSLISE